MIYGPFPMESAVDENIRDADGLAIDGQHIRETAQVGKGRRQLAF
jgi:hypothetical protein